MNMLGFLAVGLVAGVLSGLFGIGGGLVIIPALVFLFGMDQHTAQGTSLGALLLPVGLLGFLEYYRHGRVHLSGAFLIALGLFLGAYAGALWANDLSNRMLTRLFALFLMIVALRMYFSAGK